MPIYEVEITPEQKSGLMVDKPSHPPFAPNCIFCGFAYPKDASTDFKESAVIRVSEIMISLRPLDDESGIPWRKVWADVQRCAWLDEVTRLHSDTKWLSDPADYRTQPARDNAEAWRLWGLQK